MNKLCIILFSIGTLFFNPPVRYAFADCSAPAGIAGQIQWVAADTTLKWCNGTSWSSLTTTAIVPSGAVMAFNLASCPSGWSAFTGAIGRNVIGAGTYSANADADGANSSTGYALASTGGNSDLVLSSSNLPTHSHTIDPPNTATTSESSHTHTVDPPATSTDTQGAHTHTDNTVNNAAGLVTVNTGATFAIGSSAIGTTSSAGSHSHTVDIAPVTSGAGSAHSHTVDIAAFGSANAGSSTAFDNRSPFIALLYCQKD